MDKEIAGGYAGQGRVGTFSLAKNAIEPRPLDRISDYADRIERLASTVEEFGDRFYSGPCEAASGSMCREVPMGYRGQLDRVAEGLDRLDKAVHRLTEIG